jgi:hypothetical protein
VKTPVGSFLVETWWDPRTRSWITNLTSTARGGSPLLDPGGEAEYSGTRQDRDLAHGAAVERADELERQTVAAALENMIRETFRAGVAEGDPLCVALAGGRR